MKNIYIAILIVLLVTAVIFYRKRFSPAPRPTLKTLQQISELQDVSPRKMELLSIITGITYDRMVEYGATPDKKGVEIVSRIWNNYPTEELESFVQDPDAININAIAKGFVDAGIHQSRLWK